MKQITLVLILAINMMEVNGQNLPIIDMHLHEQDEIMKNGPPVYPVDRSTFPETKIKDVSELMPKTVEEMKKNHVVLGIVTWHNLEKVYKWKEYAPSMFLIGAAFYDPFNLDITFLRKEILQGRVNIIGEIGTQYNGYPPNDPRLEKFYSLAEELDVPVLIHCEGIAAPNDLFNIKDGNPLLLEDVLKKHPKLRLYIENAAYPFGQEIVALMYRYQNIYADLSTITWRIPRNAFHNYLKYLMDADLGKRLMFGSDQMIWPETIGMGIDAIKSASFLTEEQERDIFYNNAAKFLRLTEDEIKEHHKKVANR